ncbi:hypothetical protein EDD15DRAFT_2527985 [Pisolithus albus]|nr:hypothetical protein EDD15DRAFT_2527985 [Pisolithus albus]
MPRMTLSGPRSPKFPLTLRASSRFASTDTFEDGEELEEDAYDNNASTPGSDPPSPFQPGTQQNFWSSSPTDSSTTRAASHLATGK